MASESRPAVAAAAILGLAEGQRRAAGLIVIVFAVASSLLALWLFSDDNQTSASWTFHLLGVLLFAVAMPLLFRQSEDATPAEPLDSQVIIFGLIILGLAGFMRFYRLADLPFGTWYDEAELGLRAQQILLDPTYRPVFLREHSLAYYFPALIAQSFKLLGVSTLSIRALTALFGLASVILSFFLGREIYGNRFGLILAFFLAIARWPITFDRLGMSTSSGPFFIFLTLLLLFRAWRRNSPRYFGWAGLAAGIGLGLHSSYRLFPLVILAFLAYWTADQLRSHPGQRSWRIVWLVNLAALVTAAILASGPLIQVAIRQPDDFWNRTQQISIFENREEPSLARAIGSNTVKHLLMFNDEGDRNGRHNLPGEPMLDPVTGAFFVLGLFLAISRFRRPPEMLFVVVFLIGLAAAILTVDFEAPQAQRAVGAAVAVFFFASLAVEAYWRVLDRTRLPPWARPLGLALLLIAAVAIVYSNTNTYFVRQANNSAVWQDHDAIETISARKMQELAPDETTFYLSMFMQNHPVINFLAPDQTANIIVPPDIVPLREPGDRPVAVLLDLEQAWIAEEIDRFYPDAQLTIERSPEGLPMQYTVVVPAENIRQAQGLTARYWPGESPQGISEIERIERNLNFQWTAEAPLDAPFVVEWEGVLYIPEFGSYQLVLQSPNQASLWLDGEHLITTEEGGEQQQMRTLAQGNHSLRLLANDGEGLLNLAWVRPSGGEPETIPAWALYHAPMVATRGLLGTFYAGGDWGAIPALQRVDPFIDAYFHLIPLDRPYGVVWTGEIEIPESGQYNFGLRVNGQAQLFIDDQLIVDASESTEYLEGSINLDPGRHLLRLQFLDNVGASRLHLYWTPPGQNSQIIPSEVLFPG